MKNKNKILKITGIAIAVVVTIVIVAAFLFSHLVNQQIQNAKLGSFEMKNEKVDTNLLKRQIILTNTKITANNSKSNITVPKAKITGIKLFHLLLKGELAIRHFDLSGSTVYLYKQKQQNKASANTNPKDSSGSKNRTIKINHVDISDVEFHYLTIKENKPDTLFSTLIDVDMYNLNTDSSATSSYYSSFFSFDAINFIAKKGALSVGEGIYSLTFNTLKFDSEHPDLKVSQTKFFSPYSRYEIGQQTGVETDWYDIEIDDIELNDIRLQKLLRDTVLNFAHSSISGLDANIFRDKRLPFPEKPDTKLPAELVQSIPFAIRSDSLVISKSNIVFEEHGEESEDAGFVTFKNLYAKLENISNSDSLQKQPMKLAASADVMNKAKLNVNFVFTVPALKQPSKVSGSLKPVKFSAFNPMLKPYVGVNIQSGEIRQLDFNFGYTNFQSNGDIIFEYDNLDFVMFNKKNNSKKLVFTFLANTFVVSKQNLPENDSYKKGEILHERNPKKSVFSYWWKSLMNGIKSIAITV